MFSGFRRYIILKYLLVILPLLLILPVEAAAKTVYVAPVEGVIDGSTYAFLDRVFEKSKDGDAIILQIDTPGGYIWAAEEISTLILNSKIKTVAYVKNAALSAGALIALSADQLVMSPGAIIGAAEPRVGNERADPKIVSAWSKALAAAAQKNGKNPKIARAMADINVEIPGLVKKGELLTLTYNEALEYGIADEVIGSRQEVLNYYGLSEAEIVEETPRIFERLTGIVTNPYVSSFLLTVGIAGLLIEIFTLGFGIPGGIGILALAVYFAGHMMAGISGINAILLFLLGIILLVAEVFFIPGFGLAGIGGLVALVASVVLAAPNYEQALISLVTAIIGSIVLLLLSIKFLPTRRIWSRLILSDKQERERYLASDGSKSKYVGTIGEAVTPLRPAGTAKIDGKRLDVVTSGEFIKKGKKVKVIKVEGTRIVVEEIIDEEE